MDRMHEKQVATQYRGPLAWKAGAAALLLIIWVLLTWWSVRRADLEMRENLLRQAQLAAAAVNVRTIEALSGNAADIDNPHYQRLKAQFALLKESCDNCRFLYLLGRKPDGALFIFVDNEPADSRDYSPPGQAYEEAPESITQSFVTGAATVVGPVTDRWGTWVTGLVPIREGQTGKLIAVLGLDIAAHSWNKDLLRSGLPPALFALTMIIIMLARMILLMRRAHPPGRPIPWIGRLEPVLVITVGLVLTIFATWAVHRGERHTRDMTFAQVAESRTAAVAVTFRDIRENQLEGLAHFFDGSKEVNPGEFQRYAAYLTQNVAVQDWQWIPAVSAADKSLFEAQARAAGLKDFQIWQKDAQGRRIPAEGRKIYYPVFYVTPRENGKNVLGYDIGSEPRYLAALEAAAGSGLATATDPIVLEEQTGPHKGLLVFRPVYQLERSEGLRGFTLASVRMDRLWQSTDLHNDMHMTLAVMHDGGATEMLAFSGEAAAPPKAAFSLSRPIFAFGKVFFLTARPGPQFLRLHPARAGWFAAFTGLFLTAALTLVIATVIRRRRNLEQLIVERTFRLSESEARLRDAQDMALMGHWDYWHADNRLVWSETIYRLFEIDRDEFGASYEAFLAATHPDDRLIVSQAWSGSLAGNLPYAVEHRLLMKDGRIKWVVEKAQTNFDPKGRPFKTTGIVQDITSRKRAEEALRESEEAHRLLIENTLSAFAVHEIVLDDAGRPVDYTFLSANPAFETNTGLKVADVLGRRVTEVMAGIDKTPFIGIYGKVALTGESVTFEQFSDVLNRHYYINAYRVGEKRFATTFIDMTAQKKVEHALREAERKYRTLVDYNQSIIYTMRADGTVTFVSPSWTNLLGHAGDEIVGDSFAPLIHADDRRAFGESLRRTVETGMVQPDVEYRIVHKDGTLRWHRSVITPVFGEHRQMESLVGNAVDFTERKRAEEERESAMTALRNREQQIELMMTATDEGFWFLDMTTNELRFGESLLRSMGFAEGDDSFNYQWFTDHIHRNSAHVFDDAMAAYLEGRSKYYEFKYLIKTKALEWRWFWARGTCTAFSEDGKPLRFMGTHRDITEQKRIEEEMEAAQDALRAKSEELDRYFTSSLDLLCIADTEGHFVRLNPEWENVLGYPVEELRGRLFLDFVHPDDLAGTLDALSDLSAQKQVRSFENRYRCKDGSYRWIEWRSQPQGKLIYAVARDITDRKQAQSELVEANRRLKITTARANEMARQARLADQAKSEFLANMSHEIRTPMNAVIGLSKLLLETRLDSEQRDYLGHIYSSSHILLGIINDILDYSKIEAGKLVLDYHRFHLDDLTERMKSLFGSAVADKELTLLFTISPEVPRTLVGDSLRLGQVFTNLLGNAVKFTERGRVVLNIVRVDGDEEQVRLRFEVQDTGIGLEARQIGRLFQAFSQADSSTTRRYGGTGLGLAISSRLVERMGGTLQVRSTPGKGSTFFFELPFGLTQPETHTGQTTEASKRVPAAARDSAPMRVPSFAGASILLVEDNTLNQEVARHWLEKTGAQVTVAGNGAEAVTCVHERAFDLILMDLQMPVMDGFEATRRIRELYPDLPVVALSAAVMETDRQRARQSGMLGHLAKPIDENELYRTLGDWLESSDAPETASSTVYEAVPGLSTLEGFDLARGLRSADGDAAFYHRLLNHFKNQLKGEFAVIVDCLEQAGDASAPRMIHSLKAIADTVGHSRLAGIATSIDRAFKKGRKITGTMLSELRAAMNEAQFQLEALPALPGTEREITPEEGRAAVTKLLGVLRNNELVDDSLLAKVTGFLDRRLGARESDDFRIQVERFEHDAAADMLVALACRCGEELT